MHRHQIKWHINTLLRALSNNFIYFISQQKQFLYFCSRFHTTLQRQKLEKLIFEIKQINFNGNFSNDSMMKEIRQLLRIFKKLPHYLLS